MNGKYLALLNPLIIENNKKATKAKIDAKKMVRNIWIVPNQAPKMTTRIKSPQPIVCL